MKTFILTGGGSAGHAIPSLRIARALINQGYTVVYIGSQNSIEKDLATKSGIPFIRIATAKFDRNRKHTLPKSIYKNLIGIVQTSKHLGSGPIHFANLVGGDFVHEQA